MYKCINNDLLYILWLLSWCSSTGYTLVHLILVCEQPGLITDRCLCWSSSVRAQESVKRESYCNKWTKFLLHQSYGHLVGHSGTATGLSGLSLPTSATSRLIFCDLNRNTIEKTPHHHLPARLRGGLNDICNVAIMKWREQEQQTIQHALPNNAMLPMLPTYLPTYVTSQWSPSHLTSN